MRKITLKDFGIGRYDDTTPFPVGDLSLEISGFPNYQGEYRYIAHMNGKKIVQRTISATDNTVEIEQSLLAAGVLKSHIEIYTNGVLTKTLKIEDLTVKAVDGVLTAEPEIAGIINREAALEDTVKTDERTLAALKDEVKKAEKTEETDSKNFRAVCVALVKFAYSAYNAIPYLNGGDFNTFAAEIGLDTTLFTDEELTTIGATKDEKQN